VSLILLFRDGFRIFPGFIFDSGTGFFGAPRQRAFDTDVIIFGGRASEFLLFDFDHLFFAVKLFLNVLFTHSVDFLLLFLIANVHRFIFKVIFGKILDVSRRLAVDGIERAFRILFGFGGLQGGLVLHYLARDLLFLLIYSVY
jgi:hypothetical protein